MYLAQNYCVNAVHRLLHYVTLRSPLLFTLQKSLLTTP